MRRIVRSVPAVLLAGAQAAFAGSEAPRDLTRLSLEELANVQVTSALRRPERLASLPAAVFVITNEDLRRLGIKTLAEALRLAPGVQVSRINANQWSVGIRGFASGLSRAVLILVDGRSTYTPLFAGTYWDVLDTLIEDVERIEILRGPAGALWGANAMNGVVNIITRPAADTEGGYAAGVTGRSIQRGVLEGRLGGHTGATSFRVYGKYASRGGFTHPDGDDYDAWSLGQAGVRADLDVSEGRRVTLQGDVYSGRIGERTNVASYAPPYTSTVHLDAPVSGGNGLARWDETFGDGSDLSVQAYFDRTLREEAVYEEARSTLDLDAQYARAWGAHQLVAGLQLRSSEGNTTGIETVVFTPTRKTDRIFGVFLQDTWTLSPAWSVTGGVKVEHNDYSGTEVQPSLAVFGALGPKHSVWASVGRAVRAPSRVDTELTITQFLSPGPVFLRLSGDDGFRSEELIAVQGGWRMRASERLWLDLSLFYNWYDDLESFEPGPVGSIPPTPGLVASYRYANGLKGQGAGGELVAGFRVSKSVRLQASYSRLWLDLRPKADSRDAGTAAFTEGSSPRELLTVRGSADLPANLSFDAFLRGAGPLPAQKVPGYVTLDARLSWAAPRVLEIAVGGRNLLQESHVEFAGGPSSTEVPRGFFAEVSLRW